MMLLSLQAFQAVTSTALGASTAKPWSAMTLNQDVWWSVVGQQPVHEDLNKNGCRHQMCAEVSTTLNALPSSRSVYTVIWPLACRSVQVCVPQVILRDSWSSGCLHSLRGTAVQKESLFDFDPSASCRSPDFLHMSEERKRVALAAESFFCCCFGVFNHIMYCYSKCESATCF